MSQADPAFLALLDALNSENNDTRRSAEQSFKAAAEGSLEPLVTSLTNALCNDTEPKRKIQAAIQLRRSLSRKAATLQRLGPATVQGVKSGLLFSFNNDPTATVRKNVSLCVAEIAAQVAGPGCAQWPEVLQAVMDGAGKPDPKLQRSSLELLGHIVEVAGEETGSELVLPHAATIGGMLNTLLTTSTVSVDARVAALSCSSNLLQALQGEASVVGAFQGLIPAMVATLQAVFAAGLEQGLREELAGEALQEMTNIVVTIPTFFRPQLDLVCTTMLTLLASPSLDNDTRMASLEFLLNLAEEAGATVRKVPKLSETIFQLTLTLIESYEDKEEDVGAWGQADDKEEEEEVGDMHNVGASAISRFSAAIGARQAWPLFKATALPLFASPDWAKRAAAVTALSQVASACARDLATNLEELVKMCCSLLGDGHVRVRHAALCALVSLVASFSSLEELEGMDENASELAGSILKGREGGAAAGSAARARKAAHKKVKTIQETCGTYLLPALVALTDASQAPRVRGAAFSALDAFLGGNGDTVMDSTVVDANAGNILSACGAALANLPPAFHTARKHVLNCCGSIAVDMEERFQPFYQTIHDSLAGIVVGTAVTDTATADIRSSAMFALAACMEAVGVERSGTDAANFLNVVLRTLASELIPEDTSSLESCCDVMCKLAVLLGPGFAHYLPVAVPLLVAKVQKPCVVTKTPTAVNDAGETTAAAGGGGSEGDGTVSLVFQNDLVNFDPSILATKTSAMHGLLRLINSVGTTCPGFDALADKLYEVCEFYVLKKDESADTMYGDDLRLLALEALPELLNVAFTDRAPHHSGLPHAQFLLNRMMQEVFCARLGSDKKLKYGLLAQLEDIARTSYESTLPSWAKQGPADAPEAEEGAPPYQAAVVPVQMAASIIAHLSGMVEPFVKERNDIIKSKKDNPDSDEQDMEELAERLEGVDECITTMVDIVGYMIKEHKQAILPYLFPAADPAAPAGTPAPVGFASSILAYIQLDSPDQAGLRTAALCVADDLIEFTSPASHSILPAVFPHLLSCAEHENPLLRHPALYGLGLVAQFAPAFLAPHVQGVLAALSKSINAPDAQSDENLSSTDNAVSSLLKVVKFCPAAAQHTELVMQHTLGYLPLTGDEIEARLVHGWMISGLRSFDPLWTGPSGTRAVQLLRAIAKTLLAHEAAEEEEMAPLLEVADLVSFTAAYRELQQGPNAHLLGAALSSLEGSFREVLTRHG